MKITIRDLQLDQNLNLYMQTAIGCPFTDTLTLFHECPIRYQYRSRVGYLHALKGYFVKTTPSDFFYYFSEVKKIDLLLYSYLHQAADQQNHHQREKPRPNHVFLMVNE